VPTARPPLRVCINAPISSGLHGGVEQVVIGLASSLSRLTDGNEQYFFLTDPATDEWIRPYIHGPCRILHPRGRPRDRRLADRLRRAARWWAPVVRRRRWKGRWPPPISGREAELEPRSDGSPPLAVTDGTIENADIEVMHFTHQGGFLTRLPTIFQPHDLQHLHFPEFFSEGERDSRELRYRTYCDEADLVVTMTSWGKRDLIRQYGLPEAKVAVINWGSILDTYPSPSADDLEEARRRLSLPDSFVLYPAQTWPHKNHLGLLEAITLIRDRHQETIPVVCSGRRNEYFPEIERRVKELGLAHDVIFPGFVSPLELRCLYSMARALVFPSRFEGWGLPICEAFSAGVPVASSSATGLPDLVGDAGLLFNPEDSEQMADCTLRLWSDAGLRASLAERGRRRAPLFSFDHAARLFRAHYRRIADRRLSAEDRKLLETPPTA
jgi:glycosyltransferase involved in cell wall biosynthesis